MLQLLPCPEQNLAIYLVSCDVFQHQMRVRIKLVH